MFSPNNQPINNEKSPVTTTIATNDDTATVTLPMLTRKTKVPEQDIIPLEDDAFDYKKDGVTRRSVNPDSKCG